MVDILKNSREGAVLWEPPPFHGLYHHPHSQGGDQRKVLHISGMGEEKQSF